jgi:hypothetical protein
MGLILKFLYADLLRKKVSYLNFINPTDLPFSVLSEGKQNREGRRGTWRCAWRKSNKSNLET